MSECPYCLDPIDDDGDAVTCASCHALHHSGCWVENGGCCVHDCPGVVRNIELDLPSEAPEKLVLSREAVESAMPHRAVSTRNPCMRCGRQVPEGDLYCQDCIPEPEENQDVRNVGPILVMVAVLALVLAWYVLVMAIPGGNAPDPPSPPGIETKVGQ